MQVKEAYDIFWTGIPHTFAVSQEQIKRRYHTLVKRYHPDVYKEPDAHERMKAINEAYTALKGKSPPQPSLNPHTKPVYPDKTLSQMIAYANAHPEDDKYLVSIHISRRDRYTNMTFDEVVHMAGPVAVKKIRDMLETTKTSYGRKRVGTAIRWYLRGMHVDVAIRKVKLDSVEYNRMSKEKWRAQA